MKLRTRLLALLRMLFLGWNYGSIVGRTKVGVNQFYRVLTFNQAMALRFFGVTSVKPSPTLDTWDVWFSDLFELKPMRKIVLAWIVFGDGSQCLNK